MTQRTLYRLIENIGSRSFASEEDMLTAILEEIVRSERTSITGGRIWKLLPDDKKYRLVYEHGNIDPVVTGFEIRLKGYAVFEQVARRRTVLANETNHKLREKGIIRYSATGIGNRVEIGEIAYFEYMMAFNAEKVEPELKYILSIAGQAVTQMLNSRRSEAEKRSLQSEMDLARDLQRRLLPEHEYSFGNYELYGISVPERTVGGDFFNYYPLPEDPDRMGISIGDAASKGFAAAVQALFVAGALMMSVETESKISSMLRRINAINHRIFPHERFLTLCYCELFAGEEGLLLYSNAGHSKPIHYHAHSGECTELTVTGPVIGLIPDAQFTVTNTNLLSGDVLLLYTDGISEANDGEVEYGEERIIEIIKRHATGTAKDICLELLQDVQTFSADGVYSDDKTVVVIKRQ
ncbi:MAG: PP2C family protein-serine/threonine phosphatase [Bacteroidetes bacterium]|nr:PP2C family protein-serine/threonine phosphatase [Bacteroidota bacterium]